MASQGLRQILADMIGRNRYLMTTLFQRQNLFENTNMCSSIRKKRCWCYNKNSHYNILKISSIVASVESLGNN